MSDTNEKILAWLKERFPLSDDAKRVYAEGEEEADEVFDEALDGPLEVYAEAQKKARRLALALPAVQTSHTKRELITQQDFDKAAKEATRLYAGAEAEHSRVLTEAMVEPKRVWAEALGAASRVYDEAMAVVLYRALLFEGEQRMKKG